MGLVWPLVPSSPEGVRTREQDSIFRMGSAHSGDDTRVEIGGTRPSVRWGLGGPRFRRVCSENSGLQWRQTLGGSDPAERPRAGCGSVTGAGPAPASSGAPPLSRVGTARAVRGKQGPLKQPGGREPRRAGPGPGASRRGVAGPLQTSTLCLAQAGPTGARRAGEARCLSLPARQRPRR